ncbi:unnamed protein product [Ectocarpus sp. 6 AP-2014]
MDSPPYRPPLPQQEASTETTPEFEDNCPQSVGNGGFESASLEKQRSHNQGATTTDTSGPSACSDDDLDDSSSVDLLDGGSSSVAPPPRTSSTASSMPLAMAPTAMGSPTDSPARKRALNGGFSISLSDEDEFCITSSSRQRG